MTHSIKITAAALLASGLFAAGLAQAQSHSVVNYSNPPNAQADSKAATDATPGLTATADQQDANHPNKGAKDAAANKAGSKSTAKTVKKQRHASKGPQVRPASASASKDKSQSATASVALDGASKGGAEATMQADPSASEPNKSAAHAFDTTPSKQ